MMQVMRYVIKQRESGGSPPGFTLVELVVSMAIVGLVMTGLLTIFVAQDKIHKAQEQTGVTQQNVRGMIFLLKKEIRMAGYDLERNDDRDFGITDVRFRNTADGIDNSLLYSSVTFTAADYDDNGPKAFKYTILDSDGDGNFELSRQFYEDSGTDNASAEQNVINPPGSIPSGEWGRILAAKNIEAFGIAYAIDDDQDGDPDTGPGNNIIWAIDTDNDNQLDLNIDIDGDGDIDAADDTDDNNIINTADDNSAGGDAILNPQIALDRIHAARIWILGRNENPDPEHTESNVYVAGNRIVDANDHFRRRFLTSVVRCRNLGL
jgi:type IV pilus assembly protein PilW